MCDSLQHTAIEAQAVYGQWRFWLIQQIEPAEVWEIHIIATVVIAPAWNNAVGCVDSHLCQEKFQRIFSNRLIVNESYRLAYSSFFYAGGNFFDHAFAHVAVDVEFGVACNLDHVRLYAMVIKNIENAAEIVPDHIVEHDYVSLLVG